VWQGVEKDGMSIKIVESDHSLTEDVLNAYEKEDGLILIAANCAVTNEWAKHSLPGMAFKHDVTRWTYHFRARSAILDEPERMNANGEFLDREFPTRIDLRSRSKSDTI
jgi:hypothetical protein